MKVLIVDKLSPETVTSLQKLGLHVEVRSDLTADNLPTAVADVDILVVRSTKVTAATIQAAPQLSLIIRAGAGVDTIDIAWKKKEYGKARGLAGRTLGILGFGAIGKAVAVRAKALDMNVVAYDPIPACLNPKLAEEFGVGYAATPLAVATASDAVTVHMASTPETKHTINKKFLDALKPGTIVINASRGNLVDTQALKAAIAEKGLRVGLDVFENEPTGSEAEFPDKELAALVSATPHIGASTDQAAEAIAGEVVRIVEMFLKTGHPAGTVNLCIKSPATHRLVVRHYNRVGVLAAVLDGLREEGINIAEMENTIFAGAQAACCSLQLDKPPSLQLVGKLRGDQNILHVLLTACS